MKEIPSIITFASKLKEQSRAERERVRERERETKKEISLFNGISIFVRYLMPEPSLQKKRVNTI